MEGTDLTLLGGVQSMEHGARSTEHGAYVQWPSSVKASGAAGLRNLVASPQMDCATAQSRQCMRVCVCTWIPRTTVVTMHRDLIATRCYYSL